MPRKPNPDRGRHNRPVTVRERPRTHARPTRGQPNSIGSRGVQKRARNRLGRLISRGGEAPIGVRAGHRVTLEQARAIKKALLTLNAKHRAEAKSPKAAPFDPLAPLTGKNFDAELSAASRAQFADEDQQIKNAYAQNQGAQELTGSYYDNYKQSLAEASNRIKTYADQQTAESQGAVDKAYSQDSAAAKARSDAASQQAGKLGLSGTQGNEGAQAAEAARAQGNASVASERSMASGENALMENRGASAVQAKGEALGRLMASRSKISDAERNLAREKGDFNTNYRAKVRDSERQWAAVQSEFGLKKEELAQKAGDSAADRKLEAKKIASQKLIARMYSNADKAKARATIRVAKLQLEKGKIDQHQYNEIVNIYKGLPKKGTPTPAKKTPKSSGNGSGPNGSYAPWEVDGIDRATTGYERNKYGKDDHLRAVSKAVKAGIPKRLAEEAWKKYVRSLTTPYDNRVRG